jgi:AraC-like DNA-binding protein
MLNRRTEIVGYAINPKSPIHLTACGIRAPHEPFPQQRRSMADFVAFMVIKGEIQLTDELTDGIDQVYVRPGEIHLVAPDAWQSSTVPFPPGIVFLWFHFSCAPAQALTADAVDALVKTQWARVQQGGSQERWIVPRHLHLGNELEHFIHAHQAMLENNRLWGGGDRGSDVLGQALIYKLHAMFIRSRFGDSGFTRVSPEAAHVARAQAHIRLFHERPIALAEIAAAVELNPQYLSRCFRRVTGRTVGDALLNARIETAKRHLLDGYSVKAAAYHAGFGSSSYFCRQFLRITRTTPSSYRATVQQG